MQTGSHHWRNIKLILLNSVGLISLLIFSSCQGNPQNGLEPINTGIRSSPADTGLINGAGGNTSSPDINEQRKTLRGES